MEGNDLHLLQKRVHDLIQKFGGYWSPLSMLAAVTEELGELAREINAFEGYKPKKKVLLEKEEVIDKIGEELGDLLFSVICIANAFEINLEESFFKIIQKYKTRDLQRYE